MGIIRQSFYVAPSVKSLGAAVVFLVGCGGGAFEQGSPTGSELAGAAGDAAAGSIGTGGSSMLSGAAGVAGKPSPANDGGAGGELEQPAVAGAGGELEQPAAVACDRSSWKLEAFASWQAQLPALALDGDAETRWSSGAPRESGQWLALELGAAQTIEALELRTPATPGDLPSSLVVKLDGKATPATFEVSEGLLRVSFAAQPASSVRLELDAGALSWWSVAELAGLCR